MADNTTDNRENSLDTTGESTSKLDETPLSEGHTELPVTTQPPKKRRNPFSILKPTTIFENIRQKKLAPIAIYLLILTLVAVFALPATRYSLLGVVIKKPYSLSIIDYETKKPVSEVAVTIDGITAKTSKEGTVTFNALKVGNHTAEISKSNYTSTSSPAFVSLFSQENTPQIELQATGRQVNIKVTDYITKKPLPNVFLQFDDFESRSDEDGIVAIVAPPGKESLEAKISLNEYNEKSIQIKIAENEEPISENQFTITPSGSIYFLSKLTGEIDVVKSNLDGSNRVVVLKASGFETESGTVLIASRDWKHIAVKSSRNANGQESINYIDATTGNIKVADEGDATFQIIGWYDDRLIYVVNRNAVNEAERYKLKSYDTASGKIALLDISEFKSLGSSCNSYGYCGDTYLEETITKVAIVEGGIIYAKEQFGGPGPTSKIYKIRADGQDKLEVASITEGNYLQQFFAWDPIEVYYNYYDGESASYKYYELSFDDSAPKEITDPIERTVFDSGVYNAYLLSPDSQKSFWSESRDGKNAFFTGSKTGENPQELGRMGDYAAYGWFSDKYLLVTKNSSELYIMPVEGGEPAKITDYHKPENGYRPYGYGYGG